MLAEFMPPEPCVILVLRNPVLVHILKQIVLSEWLEKRADVGARVRRDNGTVWRPGRSVRRGDGVILAV